MCGTTSLLALSIGSNDDIITRFDFVEEAEVVPGGISQMHGVLYLC